LEPCKCDIGGRAVLVHKHKGETHHVHLDKVIGESCTCAGGAYKGQCRHIEMGKLAIAFRVILTHLPRPRRPPPARGGPTMPHQFAIEIEPDDQGQWHFVVVNACTDEVIRVGLSHDTREGAECDATTFVYRLLATLQSA